MAGPPRANELSTGCHPATSAAPRPGLVDVSDVARPAGNGDDRCAVTGMATLLANTCRPMTPGTIRRSSCAMRSVTRPGGAGALIDGVPLPTSEGASASTTIT